MKKVLSCLLSFLPLLFYLFLYVVIIVFSIVIGATGWTMNDAGGVISVILMVVYAILVVISVWTVMISDIVKVFKNKEWSPETKLLWCLILFFCNFWAFPVFWFVNERKKKE